jgi:hypothetical protein
MAFIKLLLLLAFAGMGTAANDNSLQQANTATASVQEFYKYLRCHRQAKNIVINWGTTSITGVHHFVVYHSEVGDFFDPIGQIDPDGTLKYTFKHENVFAGYHYYYIKAIMNAGPAIDSPVDIVRIVGH